MACTEILLDRKSKYATQLQTMSLNLDFEVEPQI